MGCGCAPMVSSLNPASPVTDGVPSGIGIVNASSSHSSPPPGTNVRAVPCTRDNCTVAVSAPFATHTIAISLSRSDENRKPRFAGRPPRDRAVEPGVSVPDADGAAPICMIVRIVSPIVRPGFRLVVSACLVTPCTRVRRRSVSQHAQHAQHSHGSARALRG